jgi:peptidoglycan-N-acetylglucosamine deacetylase
MLTFRNTTVILIIILLGMMMLDQYYDIRAVFYFILIAIYSGLVAAGSFVMSIGFFARSTTRSHKTDHRIAITFDDGPLPGKTDRILEILSNRNVPATFFCIGKRVEKHPELAALINRSGHTIGNHSYSHPNTFGFLTAKTIAAELQACQQSIQIAAGISPKFFRPPYGITNPMIAKAAAADNYLTIGWSNRSFDTLFKDGESLLQRVTRNLKAGDIILFHDYSDATISILDRFIVCAREKGFEFVTVDALLNTKPYR